MPHAIEHTFAQPTELEPGILRVTLPLPSGPKHVHSYLLREDDGWTLVDTGLGLPDSPWAEIVAGLDAPVVRIFITHMHPDHVGGAAPAAEATGAPVIQGRLDYEQCERVWGRPDWPRRIADWFLRQGVPAEEAEELLQSGHVFADFVRFAWNPSRWSRGTRSEAGACSLSPAMPTATSVSSARAMASSSRATRSSRRSRRPSASGPRVAPIRSPTTSTLCDASASSRRASRTRATTTRSRHVANRAVEIARHHDERLAQTEAALSSTPSTGFEVSHAIFGRELPPIQRRFAVAEALSHLEWLVGTGRARRHEDDRSVSYTAR